MPGSFRAFCSDFYINSKLSVKLDLPTSRETVLEMFERLRREFPSMASFKRYKDELALESPTSENPHKWAAVRGNNIRAGVVNPANRVLAYGLHRRIFEVAPFFLSISPLDVEYAELLFGFDLVAPGNHDAIVADALLGGSPIAQFAESGGEPVAECQPLLGMTVPGHEGVSVLVEVKTRSRGGGTNGEPPEPISLYVTVRRTGGIKDLGDLPDRLDELSDIGESIVNDRVVPHLLAPLREAIGSGLA